LDSNNYVGPSPNGGFQAVVNGQIVSISPSQSTAEQAYNAATGQSNGSAPSPAGTAPLTPASLTPAPSYAATQAAVNALSGMTQAQLDEAIREFNATNSLNVGVATGTVNGVPTVAATTAKQQADLATQQQAQAAQLQQANLTGFTPNGTVVSSLPTGAAPIGSTPGIYTDGTFYYTAQPGGGFLAQTPAQSGTPQQRTLSAQQADQQMALNTLTLLNNARADPFKYEAVARGVNASGIPNTIASVTGGSLLPAFQAPGGQPAPNNLGSLVNASGVSTGGSFVGSDPAGAAGINVDNTYGSLVAPNKIVSPNYFSLPTDAQDFVKSAYQDHLGITPEGFDAMVKATLPQFAVPKYGAIAA
jgi:hypothetical protein